jgi:hypothetical protein
MQKICSRVLILVKDKDAREDLASKIQGIGVPVVVAPETMERPLGAFDCVLCTSDNVVCLDSADITKTWILVGKNEEPELLYGQVRMLFDTADIRQLKAAVYQLPNELEMSYEAYAFSAGVSVPVVDYQGALLDFKNNRFEYKGQPFYLSDKNKLTLVKWIALGYKSTVTYSLLTRLRDKLGADFLRGYKRGM